MHSNFLLTRPPTNLKLTQPEIDTAVRLDYVLFNMNLLATSVSLSQHLLKFCGTREKFNILKILILVIAIITVSQSNQSVHTNFINETDNFHGLCDNY